MDIRAELERRRGRGVGPQLLEILRTQDAAEYYTEEHFRALVRYEARDLVAPPRMERCLDVHGPNCTQGCRSCHSCRQKTLGRKTECPCGRGAGVWCGSCLGTRMGQNLAEVLQRRDWRCPACLRVCNCSGRACDRHLAGLGCTKMLSGEAREQGYMSTAHYLVQTHLEMQYGIAPSISASAFQLEGRRRRGLEGAAPAAGPPKRPRLDRPAPRALRQLVAEELRLGGSALQSAAASVVELAALDMTELWLELPGPGSSAPEPIGNSRDRPGGQAAAPAAWLGAASARGASHSQPRAALGGSGELPAAAERQQQAALRSSLAARFGLPRPATAAPGARAAAGAAPAPAASCAAAGSLLPGSAATAGHSPLASDPGSAAAPVRRVPEAPLAGEAAVDTDMDGPHPGLATDGWAASSGARRAPAAVRSGSGQTAAMRTGPSWGRRPGAGQAAAWQRPLSGGGQLPPAALEESTAAAAPSAAHPAASAAGSAEAGALRPGSAASAAPVPQPQGGAAAAEARAWPADTGWGGQLAGPPRSNGLFASALAFAQDCRALAYAPGSDEHEAAQEGLRLLLGELQSHLLEPAAVSSYDRPLQAALGSESARPEHDLRDHEALKDACCFLLLAAEALPLQREEVARLLFNEDPFVDFAGSDPAARATLLKTAFDLYHLCQASADSRPLVAGIVANIAALMEALAAEHEALLDVSVAEGVDMGPLKCPAPRLADQQRQLQEDVLAVREADALLMELGVQHMQRACGTWGVAAAPFLRPQLVALVGRRGVPDDVRFQVCCLLAVFLACVAPEQAAKVGVEELWDQQHRLASILAAAGVVPLLQALANRSPQSLVQQWAHGGGVAGELHSCPKVDAIKDKLLARVMGLLAAAGKVQWHELVAMAVQPAPNAAIFWAQASQQQHRTACTLLAVALQASPGSASRRNGEELLRFWLRLALDSEAAGCGVFAFLTKVLASTAAFEGLLSGYTAVAEQLPRDLQGWKRAGLLRQVVAALLADVSQTTRLLQDLLDWAERCNRQLQPGAQRVAWEAAAARLLTAAAEPLAAARPGGAELATRALRLLPAWLRRAGAALQEAQTAAANAQREELGAAWREVAPSDAALAKQRAAFRETSLGALGGAVSALDAVFVATPPAAWQAPGAGVQLLRALLAPACETASGVHLAAEAAGQPGSGRALDVVAAQEVAAALAAASPAFLHFALGTHVHHLLERSEKAAVNTLRMLTELFSQPALRCSPEALRLLLPPLLGPLLEALFPTRRQAPSLRVQEAALAFCTSLVAGAGATLVPPLAVLPLPARNQAGDLTLLQRGSAPSHDRFLAALQRALQVLCCATLNCLGPERGRLAQAGAANASLAAVGGCPSLRPLCGQDVQAARAALTLLLGAARPQEAARAAYADLPEAAACEPPPPDFYLRLAERGLGLLLALARCGGSAGPEWAAAAAAGARPLLLGAAATDELRGLYGELLAALEASGRSTQALQLPARRAQSAGMGAAAAEQGGRLPLAAGELLHCVAGTFQDVMSMRTQDARDVHLLLLRHPQLQLAADGPWQPLGREAKVVFAADALQGELRQLLLEQKELRMQRRGCETVSLGQLRFGKWALKDAGCAILHWTPGVRRQGSSLAILPGRPPAAAASAASQTSTAPAATPLCQRAAGAAQPVCPPMADAGVIVKAEPPTQKGPQPLPTQQPVATQPAAAGVEGVLAQLLAMGLASDRAAAARAVQQACREQPGLPPLNRAADLLLEWAQRGSAAAQF